MNKSDVKEFCVQLASEYPNWKYETNVFKNKMLKHSEIWIDPSWVLHLSAMPNVRVFNKSVTKILKEGFQDPNIPKWMTRMLILSPDAHNHCMIYQKLVHPLPDAETYIRDFFERGLDLVIRFMASSLSLLRMMPMKAWVTASHAPSCWTLIMWNGLLKMIFLRFVPLARNVASA